MSFSLHPFQFECPWPDREPSNISNSLLAYANKLIGLVIGSAYKPFVLFNVDYDSDSMKVRGVRVISDGPFYGFLGVYVDVSTGFVILGDYKSSEYIALFDLYSFIRSLKVVVSPSTFESFLIGFKMGRFDFSTMGSHLLDFSKSSLTCQLLFSKVSDFMKGPYTDLHEQVFGAIHDLVLSLASCYDEFYSRGSVYQSFGSFPSYFESQSEGLGFFPKVWTGACKLTAAVRQAYRRHGLPIGKEAYNKLSYQLSSMPFKTNYSLYDYDFRSHIQNLMANLFEIADQKGLDAALEHAVCYPEQIVRVVDKVGEDLSLPPYLKKTVVEGLKALSSKTLVKEIIPPFRFDAEFRMFSGMTYSSFPIAVDAPLYRKALSRILKVIA